MTTISTRDLGTPYRKSVHPQKVSQLLSGSSSTACLLPNLTELEKVNKPLTPAPDQRYESFVLDDEKTLFEKDVAIQMRDGITLYANVYRPIPELHKKTPSLVFFAPFGKHGAVPPALFENMGVDFGKLSKYTQWELPDPLKWCGEYGYSFVQVDPRGTWWSEGTEANYLSPEEGRDGYDVVEWIAQQPWYVYASRLAMPSQISLY